MKTLEEFRSFYNQILYPKLCRIDEEREKLGKKVFLIMSAYFILATLLSILYISWAIKDSSEIEPAIICGLFGFGFVIYAALIRKYVTNFKKIIISDIASFIDSSLSFVENVEYSLSEINDTNLFSKTPDYIHVSDYFEGKIGQTQVSFCELNLSKKSGKHSETIFNGLYFIADCNKDFKGKTTVRPDFAEKNLGRLGAFFQQKTNSNIVRLENIDFEKEFVVYSDDQIEARYLISPALMERILDFRKKTGHEISISFVNTNLHIAISYSRNLFEPKVFETIINYGEIEQYYKDLMFFIEIVEDFNLNNRIWTKE